MEYMIGIGLALLTCVFATLVGFDRDRIFYPTLLALMPTYYILFACIGGSTSVLAVETLAGVAFFWRRRGRLQKKPLADCGRPRRARSFRLLSSSADSESRCPEVVARLLPFV